MATNLTGGRPPVLDEANPSISLGAEYVSPDGRKYRYARAGSSALVIGNVLQSRAEDTGEQGLTPGAVTVGSTSFTTTSTPTVTANQYAGGYVVVTVTPDLGGVYRIKSHPATTGAALLIYLDEPIQTAWTAATRIDLVPNAYDGVIAAPTTPTGALVGVAVNNISANQYGFIQTSGLGPVLADAATVAIGSGDISLSNATTGAVESWVSGQPKVGRAITGIASGEVGLAYIQLD